jgi:hypothetical protein
MSPLAETIADELRAQPQQFSQVADRHREVSWPDFLKAWGEVRTLKSLGRDDDGNYVLSSEAPTG